MAWSFAVGHFKVPCLVLRACLAFELFWTTRILIDLHDVLPSFPLSSADTMLTLPHSLELVWLMKDLCPKPVEDTHSFGKVSLTMLDASIALVLLFGALFWPRSPNLQSALTKDS